MNNNESFWVLMRAFLSLPMTTRWIFVPAAAAAECASNKIILKLPRRWWQLNLRVLAGLSGGVWHWHWHNEFKSVSARIPLNKLKSYSCMGTCLCMLMWKCGKRGGKYFLRIKVIDEFSLLISVIFVVLGFGVEMGVMFLWSFSLTGWSLIYTKAVCVKSSTILTTSQF